MDDGEIRSAMSGDDWDAVAAVLVKFHRSRSPEELLEFLSSDVEACVRNAVWIASELGVRAEPIVHAVIPLLQHHSKLVRCYSLDCLVSCQGMVGSVAVDLCLRAVRDPEHAVRWKGMLSLCQLSEELFDPEAPGNPCDENEPHLRDLLTRARQASEPVLERWFHSPEASERRMAAVAAVRERQRLNAERFDVDTSMVDDELASFLRDFRGG